MSEAGGVPDLAERARALDTSASFIVQAPAGSGKTELLIQRYLALLAGVGRPEEIAAITFTIKAAAEMRARVLQALRSARREPRPGSPHQALTWDLARAALERNDALGWKLEESATRLRVQTIDALCASLTRQMPVLSRFGAQPESVEEAGALYAQAARNLLDALEEPGDPVAADLARLLSHLDNNALAAERLVAGMLERRDHWVRFLARAHDRDALEAALREMREASVAAAVALWPAALPAPRSDDVEGWRGRAAACLTKDGKWRSATSAALRENEALRLALCDLQRLPEASYEDVQWEALEAIVRIAPRAIAELQLVFAARGQADFVEVAQGALRALGEPDRPTDLMLALDYRIRHILVDEFQDTSSTQFELLERLTSGWEPGDARTLFLVGDPMQSIYRFREAEVGRFLQAWREGIGTVRLEPVLLRANFRSQSGLVAWVNQCFGAVMPREDDIPAGAVKYAPSEAVLPGEEEPVVVHAFYNGDRAGEGRRVAEVARAALARTGREGKPATVAILVRNRTHLAEVLPRLREAGLAFRAIEIEPLGHRPAVQELLALTRALSHLADSTAWLAVLRAPWCGLTLADLHTLASTAEPETVWSLMNDAARVSGLSPDGRARLERTRDVLARALAGRRRSSLRAAVEGAWLALGGPAGVDGETGLEDADIYLDHLERAERCGALDDLAAFEETVARLFALPDLEAPEALQVMTIHKSKGLEFDTVIVPGLDAGSGRDEAQLFTWMETPAGRLLIAPIDATGSEREPASAFIHELDKKKDEHERARLLYVAATRARAQLHLLGCASLDRQGEVREPSRGTLLHRLWPVVAGRFPAPEAPAPRASAGLAVPPARQGELRRVARVAPAFAAPPAVAWNAAVEERAPGEVEFSWVGDTLRRVGSVVHRWLQRIAEEGAQAWSAGRIAAERPAIVKALVVRGVAEPELERACDRVVAALSATLADERGRWLLGAQRNARNEHRVSAVIDGVRCRLVVDRVFDDAEGRAWIVDYKTSSHEGTDLEAFLDRERERYRAQLERYALALGDPRARRALYFPLLKGWREWPEPRPLARAAQGELFG